MCNEYKERYMVTITNAMTATGIFRTRVDCPFKPEWVAVRMVSYSEAHDLVIVRVPFVQGRVLTFFTDNVNVAPHTLLKLSNGVSGEYEFQCVDASGVIKTNMNTGQLGIFLEFLR